MSQNEVLKIYSLYKSFGKVTAVNNVSFSLREKEILSIVGPNGAGKTTLLNLISGIVKPDRGRIEYLHEGRWIDITGFPPNKVSQLKIGRSFQIPNIFDGLSVEDNIRISIISMKGYTGSFRRKYDSYKDIEDKVEEILKIFGLESVRDRTGAELSHGERKKLDIAISFAQDPKVILLDEPTSGLTYSEKIEMAKIVKSLRDDKGLSFIVVEHDLDVVREISDMLIVMYEGSILAYDQPEVVIKMSEVISAYLGGEIT